jgi:CheY-like chemotaxis protein
MRQPRLNMLKDFLTRRGYEVLAFNEPCTCPIYEKLAPSCEYVNPCSDITITDFNMPRMNGVELLKKQSQRDCKIDIRNKVIISANIGDENLKVIEKMGCSFMHKPFNLAEFSDWLDECSNRIDLSQPVGDLQLISDDG